MERCCYLVGAMSCYKDTPEYEEKAVLWREELRVIEDCTRLEIFDPTQIQTNNVSFFDQCIVELNLRKLKESVCIIANAENVDKSPGSIVELTYAHLNNVPVFWFGELSSKSPHIIRILGPNKYSTIDDVIEAVSIVYKEKTEYCYI